MENINAIISKSKSTIIRTDIETHRGAIYHQIHMQIFIIINPCTSHTVTLHIYMYIYDLPHDAPKLKKQNLDAK